MTDPDLCPDCGTQLTTVRGRRHPRKPYAWCWRCERALRPGEARRAQLASEAARAEALAALGPPVDPRYRRAVQRQQEKPPKPPIWCAASDLEETGDEGWLGLLVVLGDEGWILSERQAGDRVLLWATNADGSYVHGVSGDTAKDRALALFRELYSAEPDAIACAAAFWPPPQSPPAPTRIEAHR